MPAFRDFIHHISWLFRQMGKIEGQGPTSRHRAANGTVRTTPPRDPRAAIWFRQQADTPSPARVRSSVVESDAQRAEAAAGNRVHRRFVLKLGMRQRPQRKRR